MDVPDLVPLFPLPDHVLLLGVPMPYRVFEPRYRALVDDLLGCEPERRFLAVPRLSEGWETDYHGNPDFAPCAALALVRNIRPLADAQFLVVVEGVRRCRLDERPSTNLYRMAHPNLITDLPEKPEVVELAVAGLLVQLERLCSSLGKRSEALGLLMADRTDHAALVDRLGAALLGNLNDRQTFLEARLLTERIGLLQRGLAAVLAQIDKPGRWDPSPN